MKSGEGILWVKMTSYGAVTKPCSHRLGKTPTESQIGFDWVSSWKFVSQTQFGGENTVAEKFLFLTEGKNVM